MEYLGHMDIFGLDSSNTTTVVPPKGLLCDISNQTIWTCSHPFCTSIVSIEMSTKPGMWSIHWESIHTNGGVPKRTSIVLYYELPIYMCLWAYRRPGNPDRLSMYWESTHKEHRAPKRGGLIWMERQRKLAAIEAGFILWCVKPVCVDAFFYSLHLTNLACYQYNGKPPIHTIALPRKRASLDKPSEPICYQPWLSIAVHWIKVCKHFSIHSTCYVEVCRKLGKLWSVYWYPIHTHHGLPK